MSHASQDISEVMESVVNAEVSLFQRPVAYMQKEDKLGIVARLEQKGIFAVKNPSSTWRSARVPAISPSTMI